MGNMPGNMPQVMMELARNGGNVSINYTAVENQTNIGTQNNNDNGGGGGGLSLEDITNVVHQAVQQGTQQTTQVVQDTARSTTQAVSNTVLSLSAKKPVRPVTSATGTTTNNYTTGTTTNNYTTPQQVPQPGLLFQGQPVRRILFNNGEVGEIIASKLLEEVKKFVNPENQVRMMYDQVNGLRNIVTDFCNGKVTLQIFNLGEWTGLSEEEWKAVKPTSTTLTRALVYKKDAGTLMESNDVHLNHCSINTIINRLQVLDLENVTEEQENLVLPGFQQVNAAQVSQWIDNVIKGKGESRETVQVLFEEGGNISHTYHIEYIECFDDDDADDQGDHNDMK